MIYSALIVPNETPPTLNALKRALIAFDKVFLSHPDDRDLIPPHALFSTWSAPSGFQTGVNVANTGLFFGPVRPLGKIKAYNSEFDKLLEQAASARKQGLLEVISSYDPHSALQQQVGRLDLGGYPLDPRDVMSLYRAAASNNDFLAAALQGDAALRASSPDDIAEIAAWGVGDGSIGDEAALPLLASPLNNEECRKPLTAIARGRLGAAVKFSGFCDEKDLLPLFTGESYRDIIRLLLKNTVSALDRPGVDQSWAKRSRILSVCHDEFIDEHVLAAMTIEEVLSMRTSDWHKAQSGREALFQSLAMMSRELDQDENFDPHCRARVLQYLKDLETFSSQQRGLRRKIKCDVGIALSGIAGAVMTVSQLQSPLGIFGTLAAGTVWVSKKLEEYGSLLEGMSNNEKQLKRTAAFGLHQFYKDAPASRLR